MSDDKPYLLDGHMYQYDLGWMINQIQQQQKALATALDNQTITYADPIQWDITSQYAPITIVVNPQTGTAYISKQAVPRGILLTNTDYWLPIFNYQAGLTPVMQGTALSVETGTTATKDYLVNDLLWYKSVLYRVTRPLAIGDALTPNYNIVATSVESLLAQYYGRDRSAQVANDIVNVAGDYTLNAGDAAITADNATYHSTKDTDIDVDGNLTVDVSGTATETFNKIGLNVNDKTFPITFPDRALDLYKLADAPVYNVKDYGAIGDDNTDDTVSIQACITAAGADGCILFPAGTYKISSQLTSFGNLRVVGLNATIHSTYAGAGNLITFNKCDITGLRVVSNTSHTGAVFYSNDYNNAKFCDVTIYYGAVGIQASKGSDKNGFGLHISNANISDCAEAGIKLEGGADFFIQDSIINACGVGIIADKTDGLYCNNVDIISCDYAFRGYCYTGNLGSCFFVNTLFDSSKKDNFRIDGSSGNYIMTSLHLSNCWFSNNLSAAGCFLSLVRHAEITGCIFQYSKNAGLNIDKSNNVIITGCTFYANSDKNNANIILTSCAGSIVNGCSIGGVGTGTFSGRGANRSIYMLGCTDSIIVNNRAFDNTANDVIGVEAGAIVKNNIGIADR